VRRGSGSKVRDYSTSYVMMHSPNRNTSRRACILFAIHSTILPGLPLPAKRLTMELDRLLTVEHLARRRDLADGLAGVDGELGRTAH
jgi:hypothetical protein